MALSFALIALLVVGSLLIHRIVIIIYRVYFHPLAKFPGPWYYAASRLPHLIENNVQGTFYEKVMKLHDRYGNMVRIGPDYLAIDGSIGWKDVYGHKNFGQPEFSKNAHYFPPAESKGNFIVSRQEDHRRIRRLLAHAFSDKALQEQESIIKSYVDLLITRLKQHQGQIIDMCRWYNFTTFDLIGDLAFGDSFQCLATEALHPWVFMIFKMIKVVSIFRFFTEYPFLQPLLNILITKKQDQDRKDHLAFVRNKAMSRVRAGESQRKDFMTYILRHNDEKGMSPDEIVAASNVMIIAGSETTATLLSGFTYYILKHPRVYNKLIEQIRTTFEREEEITILSVNKMEYLLACLDEALRIYPPVAEQVSRISPGDNVDGQYVPEGTEITIHQWATYHTPRNFSQPDSYIPERWFPATHPEYDPRFSTDNKACFQPFATGPRNCLGRNLAYAEMRLIAARILWNFDLELMPECDRWIEGQKLWMVYEKPPLMVKLSSRFEDKA